MAKDEQAPRQSYLQFLNQRWLKRGGLLLLVILMLYGVYQIIIGRYIAGAIIAGAALLYLVVFSSGSGER